MKWLIPLTFFTVSVVQAGTCTVRECGHCSDLSEVRCVTDDGRTKVVFITETSGLPTDEPVVRIDDPLILKSAMFTESRACH